MGYRICQALSPSLRANCQENNRGNGLISDNATARSLSSIRVGHTLITLHKCVVSFETQNEWRISGRVMSWKVTINRDPTCLGLWSRFKNKRSFAPTIGLDHVVALHQLYALISWKSPCIPARTMNSSTQSSSLICRDLIELRFENSKTASTPFRANSV